MLSTTQNSCSEAFPACAVCFGLVDAAAAAAYGKRRAETEPRRPETGSQAASCRDVIVNFRPRELKGDRCDLAGEVWFEALLLLMILLMLVLYARGAPAFLYNSLRA